MIRPRFNRLLLIDDEPGIRRMMSLDLESEGYQVTTAADGYQGLKAFDALQPDVVITDLKMPGLDGIEVLSRIKLMKPDTEVIVITGHGDIDLAVKSLQLEAGDFISKPINDQALYVALKRSQDRLALKAELASYTQDLEQKVEQATARVLANERLAAVGQSVSALVHSLKNMLGGLRGGTYMAKEGHESARPELVEQGIAMLERNLRRVSSLVRDLLTIAKPRIPDLAPVDPVELAADAVLCLQADAKAKDVDLAMETGNPCPQVSMECAAILDALQNIIANGIDAAAESNHGRVRVSLVHDDEELCFVVQDNGPGLEPETEQRIFGGFYSTKGAAGTGLGLMVAQKTAQEHGGRVEFDNQAPQGATFRLVLPMAPATGMKTSRTQ